MTAAPPARHQEVLKRWVLGPLLLDPARNVLTAGGRPLPLGPRLVAMLAALVERRGDVVTKDELLDRVWGERDVNESNIAQSVYALRKILRQYGLGDAIVTVARRGYRYAGTVGVAAPTTPAVQPAQPLAAPNPWRRSRMLIAAALAIALVMPPGGSHPSPASLSARGAESYRLGRYYWNLRTQAGLAKSSALFAAVTRSDPRSPLGYTGIADAAMMVADYQHAKVARRPLYDRARAAIATALVLDPDSAAAHASRAILAWAADHDAAGADREFQRALALDPGYAPAHHWYGVTLFERGRLADATRELHAAATLDPISAATGAWLAEASFYGGRFDEAIAYERRALDLDPQRSDALRTLGLAYELTGNLPSAIATFRQMRVRRSDADLAPGLLAAAYARSGRTREARAALREALRVHPRFDDTAFALLALGERAHAVAILRPMCGRRDGMAAFADPRLAAFGIDPCAARQRRAAPTG